MGAAEYQRITDEDLQAVTAGDPAQLERLRGSSRLVWKSPYEYPGRGPVWVYLDSAEGTVRLSDGGHLIKFLEAVGMDPAMDSVISKVLLHALNDTQGARMKAGRVFLDSRPEEVGRDVNRFLQVLMELIGLRHCKYKDALIKLSQSAAGRDSPPGSESPLDPGSPLS